VFKTIEKMQLQIASYK